MHQRRLILLLLTCLFAAAGARAQDVAPPFSNLRVIDNPALAGVPVIARSLYTPCVRDEGRGESQLVISGNLVTLTITMDPKVPEGCFGVPPPPGDVDYALGSFAPGTYTLVQQVVSSVPGVTFLPLTTAFVVGIAPHHPVPVNSLPPLLVLAFGIAAVAWWSIGLRPRRRRIAPL
jgi:hypothetical protein